MGGSGVAFGHCSVCQIFVFFILTLFVVDNKMVGNTVCCFEIFKGRVTQIKKLAVRYTKFVNVSLEICCFFNLIECLLCFKD